MSVRLTDQLAKAIYTYFFIRNPHRSGQLKVKKKEIETLYPALFVGWSVGPLFIFRCFWACWAHCSCLNAPVTFPITAPAHPLTTGVAVYLALFLTYYYLKQYERLWRDTVNHICILQLYSDQK